MAFCVIMLYPHSTCTLHRSLHLLVHNVPELIRNGQCSEAGSHGSIIATQVQWIKNGRERQRKTCQTDLKTDYSDLTWRQTTQRLDEGLSISIYADFNEYSNMYVFMQVGRRSYTLSEMIVFSSRQQDMIWPSKQISTHYISIGWLNVR